MKKADLRQYGFEIEREEKDKSGNTFIILAQPNSDLAFIVRNQRTDRDNFFMLDLYKKERAYELFERFIKSR